MEKTNKGYEKSEKMNYKRFLLFTSANKSANYYEVRSSHKHYMIEYIDADSKEHSNGCLCLPVSVCVCRSVSVWLKPPRLS
jgi:hypothetical protein